MTACLGGKFDNNYVDQNLFVTYTSSILLIKPSKILLSSTLILSNQIIFTVNNPRLVFFFFNTILFSGFLLVSLNPVIEILFFCL